MVIVGTVTGWRIPQPSVGKLNTPGPSASVIGRQAGRQAGRLLLCTLPGLPDLLRERVDLIRTQRVRVEGARASHLSPDWMPVPLRGREESQ